MSTIDKAEAEAESTMMLLSRQVPAALVGLAAIVAIVCIHLQRPPLLFAELPAAVASCVECGTVVAVRRSAHSEPVYFVDVKMTDGSVKTLQQAAVRVSIGDIVQVHGNQLTLRPA